MLSARQQRRLDTAPVLNGAARFRRWWVPYLWVTPAVAAIAAFYIFPFIQTVSLSMTDADPLTAQGDFVGLENFRYIFSDPSFWGAAINSVVYAIVVVPIMIILPLLLAVLVKENVPGIGWFRSLYYVPAVSSIVVVSLAWTALLRDDGLVNQTMIAADAINGPLPFLTGRWLLLFASMTVTIWLGLPYYMILYLSALANVDRSLYEAAELDGAGAVGRFFNVTVPGVKIMMGLVGTLTAIGCLKVFSEVHLLSNGTGGIGGESQTLTMYIRSNGIADPTYGSLGIGGAASLFLFVMTLFFILLSQVLTRKAENQ